MPSTYYYTGLAPLVAQVSTAAFASYNVGSTRTITIGNVTYGLVDSGGNLTAALAAFATYLNLATAGNPSAHAYFGAITWTSDATHIIGTADVAGCAFVMTGATTGTGAGAATIATTTANSGPNDISVASNYSGAVYPSAGDTVVLANSANNLCWGSLAVGSTGLAIMRQEFSFTGKVGLNYLAFATSADGATVNASYPEYRNVYLPLDAIQARIGDASSISSSQGSGRSNWNLGSAVNCTVEIVNTANSSADSGRPAVRLIGNKTGHAINVRLAPGGVGIAAEIPGETSTVGTINVSDQTGSSKLVTGRGITINTSFIQDGGSNTLASDQTMPLTTINGGTLTIEGAGGTTVLNCYGGTTNHNATGTTALIVMRGGTMTSYGSAVARTWTAVQLWTRSTLTFDTSVVTITNNSIAAQERITIAT